MDIVPVLLIIVALGIEQAGQLVGYLSGDVGGELLDIAVVLQETAADVQRQIGAVDHALEQHQELRDDFLDVIRHEDLTAEEFDLTFLGAEIIGQFGEIEDALEVEGIIDVQVDIKQRIVEGVEDIMIEGFVLVRGAVLGILEPEGGGGVDQLRSFRRFVGLGRFAFFRLFGIGGRFGLYHVKVNGCSHESAVAVEHFAETIFLQKFGFFLRNVQVNDSAALGTVAGLHGESHAVLADPANGFGSFGGGQSVDCDLVGHHKGGIEAKTEVTNDAALVVPFVVLQKFFRAGESHLIDVFFHFFGSHADAIIGKADLFRFLVKRDSNTIVAFLIGMEHLFFGDGITAVGNHFADEDILIGIEPTLDDGHDVLCMNGNVTFLLLGHSRRLRDNYGVGVPLY